MSRGTNRSFRQIEALIRAHTGLSIEHVRPHDRARLIRQAMERAGVREEERYVTQLRGAPNRLLDLASEMSVGETYFFRELEQLSWAIDVWLPKHLVAQKSGHELSIWSAGCASGEEAYTLAMLLGERGLLERAAIVGSDISEPALARARAGRYSAWSLRATPELARQRFFTRRGAEYQLDPSLMSRVRFERQNLSEEEAPLPGSGRLFDLVLCRNVLIYLTRDAQLAVSRRLAHSLVPGGVMIAGASDPFVDLPGVWQRSVAANGVSFMRLGAANAPSRTAVSARAAAAEAAATGPRETHVGRKREPRHERARLPQGTSGRSLEALHTLSKQGGRVEAVEACRSALRETPLAPELHLLLVSLLIELDRHDEAEAALRKLLYVDRRSVMGHWMAGLLLRRSGQQLRAARAYRRVAALCADQPGETLVPLGEGVSHAALQELAAQEAHRLEQRARAS